LAFLAGQTETVGLATGVLVLPHHPVVLAKRVASVDALSGGRLRLSAGMGWMKERSKRAARHSTAAAAAQTNNFK
jgi:alkanesulfonate monooxygenase SsuD/methylene tetrahydromethanopterin reductase-like flavin-dependent oxidoreductase (luciferase family)